MSKFAAGALAAVAALIGGAGAAQADAATGPVSTGHSAWAWGSPTPQGQNLSAVAFAGTTGYAVGNFGTVLRSDDAGATWTGLPSDTISDLSVVQELSPTTVVAGGGCSVEESTDSGQTFQQLPLGLSNPCTDDVAAVTFATAQQGYVATQSGALLYTHNAGATVQARSSVPVGGGQLTGLAFSSPTTGLAVTSTGTIQRTTDGGNSWNQVQVVPTGLRGVTIVNPTLAFAVGDRGALLSSTDGGLTWSGLPLTLTGGGAAPNLHTITCADPDDCLISTTNANELVRTTDGGKTGTIVSASNQALNSVAYTTGTRVVAVGSGGATVISDDAGQTFPTVASGAVADFGAFGNLLTAGHAAGTAYLAGDRGIVATNDSGRSWSLLRVPTSQSINSVAFTSTRNGYALDAGGVLRRTTDGGMSWSSFAAGHSPRSALAAPTARTLLLVGPRGIFRSTDRGANFHKVQGRLRLRRGKGATVASLHFNAALTVHGGVVAYDNSTGAAPVLVSRNAGRTWRSVPLPPHNRHGSIAVSAVSPSRLWFMESNVLYATSDGGRHWRALASTGHLGDLAHVSFSSPQNGIIGLGGRLNSALPGPLRQISVLRTSNGGRTWTPDVIAGQSSAATGDVLATSTGDLAALAPGTGITNASPSLAYFTTAGTPKPARHTTLTIRFAPRQTTSRALARAHHSVLVTGRVRPVLAADEKVAVSFRANKGHWRVTSARVASNGAFRLHVGNVRTGAQVVAQALGTSAIAGAGTPVRTLSVKR